MQGIPLPVVARLLGHAQVQMTLRYAHVSDRDVEAAAERIGGGGSPERTGLTRMLRNIYAIEKRRSDSALRVALCARPNNRTWPDLVGLGRTWEGVSLIDCAGGRKIARLGGGAGEREGLATWGQKGSRAF